MARYLMVHGIQMLKYAATGTYNQACATKGNAMKSSTKDQVKGAFHEIKGAVKEFTGVLTDNPKLKAKGIGEKIAGRVQKKVGQIEKVIGR